jgi:hypothetical protein
MPQIFVKIFLCFSLRRAPLRETFRESSLQSPLRRIVCEHRLWQSDFRIKHLISRLPRRALAQANAALLAMTFAFNNASNFCKNISLFFFAALRLCEKLFY